MNRLEKTALIAAFTLVCVGLSAHAFATTKPETPQPTPTSTATSSAHSDAVALSSSTSNSGAQSFSHGGNASSYTGDSNANNSLTINDRDVRQAPSSFGTPIFASGPCTVATSGGLSGPGFGVSGGKARIDAECNLREMVRILTPLNPRIALKLACTDEHVKAIAGDCELPPAPVPCQVCEPKADLSEYVKKSDLIERDKRILEKVTSK